MLTLFINAVFALGYLTVGRIYGKVSWDIWKNHPRTSLRARLWFPLSSRNNRVYGTSRSTGDSPILMDFYDHTDKGRKSSYILSSFLWPLMIAWTLSIHLLRPPIKVGWRVLKFTLVSLPDRLVVAPAMLKRAGQRLLAVTQSRRKELTSAPSVLPPPSELTLALAEPSDYGSEYRQIVRRRQELTVEMDRLSVQETELARQLGGPDEARKLLDLPGKKL